ncbi:TonB-dependent receptor plug domain-containing protein [Arcticibacterium luteifluviistationis]|uniref:TonB-dependent receptor n=1 Tax=Arcticibacterium luteifluviistationis TaxID=1784714 RepID=A0A2Z4GIB1_9BACT|nr:TonB-dependent receptor [Arcticibacterium luteifluviistationis]AWW00706.1 TonB-dependent receptor [Arcticibacterium luteifluviistationis]
MAQVDSLLSKDLEQVVVTATKSERQLSSLPMPVTVIAKKQIQQMGSLRLSEVLAEQTGLFIVNDHGNGVQLQGFNPDYTLILVDGEPLIGRTAGTLELSRLAVGNIKQIEIVKGPSSSLYGSEALAGVINIITEQPDKMGGDVYARYGSNNTWDLSALGNFKKEKLGISLFANHYSSAGYDLTPETVGNTVSPFSNYTLQPRINYDFSENTKLKISGRLFEESQSGNYEVEETDGPALIAQTGAVHDKNLNLSLNHKFSTSLGLTARLYASGYETESLLTYDQDKSVYDESYFNQTFFRPEAILDFSFAEKHFFLVGAGMVNETVEATRYDELKKFNTKYIFGQYEFYGSDKFQVNVGGRYDAHSAYRNQFSPKLAAMYKVNSQLKLRGSVGVGYKAPDFRQLYLNFTNAVAGYSVFGSQELETNIAKLESQGQISNIFIDPSSFGLLNPESSLASNIGLLFTNNKGRTATVNFFRNDVSNLIESFPVAQKTNGQNVYSYRNLAEVFTQGAEVNVSQRVNISFGGSLKISGGYQYLEAKDKSILAKISEGSLYRRNPESLETERVSRRDYGGLLNRSKHSANLKFFYETDNKLGFNIRGMYRGRYGFNDQNGNAIIDMDDEYAKGFLLVNTSVSKSIDKWTLQTGIDNVLNFKDAQYQPGQAGRQLWIRLRYSI